LGRLSLTTEVNMSLAANDTDEQISDEDQSEQGKDLAIIREQTSETLQILRNLLSMMMPKEDDGSPKLVDLIAALVAQQRDILVGIKRVQTDMNALLDRLDGEAEAQILSKPAG
jgi:DNA-directed RNA polymerase sigma subunit (sigma70/sigma32)